jgi:hypothetical protein
MRGVGVPPPSTFVNRNRFPRLNRIYGRMSTSLIFLVGVVFHMELF